jgi:regulator of sirC expression with transglutaminase-like and TPR domain
VLEEGRKVAPRDEEIALTLGQVRYQRAQSAPEESQRETYDRAGDAFAAAAELDPENEDAYLAAGEAYDRAGQPAQAIKYWNGYLELEPEGEQADAVKERISELLEGEENTTGGG